MGNAWSLSRSQKEQSRAASLNACLKDRINVRIHPERKHLLLCMCLEGLKLRSWTVISVGLFQRQEESYVTPNLRSVSVTQISMIARMLESGPQINLFAVPMVAEYRNVVDTVLYTQHLEQS